MKSLQWEQKVGCLKNLGMNLCPLTLKTFFFFKAPLRPRTPRPKAVFKSPPPLSSFEFSSSAIAYPRTEISISQSQ